MAIIDKIASDTVWSQSLQQAVHVTRLKLIFRAFYIKRFPAQRFVNGAWGEVDIRRGNFVVDIHWGKPVVSKKLNTTRVDRCSVQYIEVIYTSDPAANVLSEIIVSQRDEIYRPLLGYLNAIVKDRLQYDKRDSSSPVLPTPS